MIRHNPILPTHVVESHYTQLNLTPTTYVCTTSLSKVDKPVDIFYQATPHPEYGNSYFGLYYVNEKTYICNADEVESLFFACVLNDDNEYEYSQFRHDYRFFENGNMIDGGRDYVRSTGPTKTFQVRKGKMVAGSNLNA